MAEIVRIIKGPSEAAIRVADLLMRLDGPVGVEKQNPDCATICSAVVIIDGAYSQVLDIVTVQVA